MPAEIFDTRTRAKGVSISVMVSFAFNTLIGQITPIAMAAVGWRYYLLFVSSLRLVNAYGRLLIRGLGGLQLHQCCFLLGDTARDQEAAARGDEFPLHQRARFRADDEYEGL